MRAENVEENKRNKTEENIIEIRVRNNGAGRQASKKECFYMKNQSREIMKRMAAKEKEFLTSFLFWLCAVQCKWEFVATWAEQNVQLMWIWQAVVVGVVVVVWIYNFILYFIYS